MGIHDVSGINMVSSCRIRKLSCQVVCYTTVFSTNMLGNYLVIIDEIPGM